MVSTTAAAATATATSGAVSSPIRLDTLFGAITGMITDGTTIELIIIGR